MSTLLWDVQAALRTRLDAAVEVPVYDAGSLIGDDLPAFVTVGEAGDNGETATAEQEESPMGVPGWTTERGEVLVVVTAWDGSTDVDPLREQAKALHATCADVVRADSSLGGLLKSPGFARVARVALREAQTDRGALVEATFLVSYEALIT